MSGKADETASIGPVLTEYREMFHRYQWSNLAAKEIREALLVQLSFNGSLGFVPNSGQQLDIVFGR